MPWLRAGTGQAEANITGHTGHPNLRYMVCAGRRSLMAQQATKWQRVADELQRRIKSGEFAADKALPTEAELQEQYEVSRNTVREAVKLLVQLHLVETRAGQGTFVAKEFIPFVTTLSTDPTTGLSGGEEGATYPAVVGEQGRKAGAKAPEVAVLKCPAHIAVRLGITEADRVVSRHQERYIDGTIWSLQTSYYPLKWVTMGAEGLLEPDDIQEGAVEHIAKTIGLKQVGYRDLVSARLPTDKEQVLFNLSHSHTVIEVFRTSFTADKTPMRVTVTVFPSDRNQIVYAIGEVPKRKEEPVPS
jgi:GntR family transcriptional regulator